MSESSRVVVVTGGNYGIGRGAVRLFAGRGDTVVIAARNRERGEALEREINAAGKALFLETDVREEDSIRAMVDRAISEFGGLDVLVNNAGIERYARADEYSSADFDAIVDTNLRGMFLCAKYAFPHLAKRRGSIVNVSSVQAFANERNISAYAAAKAGILGMTRAMAIDFAPAGVRVNAVCPGAVGNTGMMENAMAAAPDPEGAVASAVQSIPLGRMAQPEDIAFAVAWLASGEAAYITGTSLVVDGGLLAKLAL